MKLLVFSSGSSGNSTLVQTKQMNILIDAGITKKAILEGLNSVGLDFSSLDMVLFTHEHVDHVKALPQLLKLDGLKLFMSCGTYDEIRKKYQKDEKNFALLESKMSRGELQLFTRLSSSMMYAPIDCKDVHIEVLPLFHDAVETVGFTFSSNGQLITYITDTGYVHNKIMPLIANSDLYLLEANHDPTLLMYSSRPYDLKKRILSDHGHLSNEDSMITLLKSMGDKTKIVLHAHVSRECNNEAVIELTRSAVFEKYNFVRDDVRYVVLKDSISEVFEI